VATAEPKLKKKVVPQGRKMALPVLQRERWVPVGRNPLQRGEEVF